MQGDELGQGCNVTSCFDNRQGLCVNRGVPKITECEKWQTHNLNYHTQELNNGMKFDSAKTRWELVPWDQLKEVAEVMTMGAEKYAPNSWQQLENGRLRYTGAILRHIMAWIGGERKDKESGRHHLAHVVCNALFLIYFDQKETRN